VLATATISSTGRYNLNLPEGLDLSANLVLRVRNGDAQLRAVATHEVVDVDPVSEFITERLILSDIDLSSLALNEVVRLRGQVDGFDIAAGSDLASAFAALATAAGPAVDYEITEIAAAVPGVLPSARDYFLVKLGVQLGLLDESPEVWVLSDDGLDVTLTPADSGKVDVSFGATNFTGIASFGSGAGAMLWVENEFEGPGEISARYSTNGTVSIDTPFEEDIYDDDDGNPELGIRTAPQTVRLVTGETGGVAYVGLSGESEFLYGVTPQGLLDEDTSRGYRDGLDLALMVERASGTPALGDNYGLVVFEQGLGQGGCVETITGLISLTRGGVPNEFSGSQWEDRTSRGCGDVDPVDPSLTIGLIPGAGGGVSITDGGDGVIATGHSDAAGSLMLFPVGEEELDGDSIGYARAGMIIGLEVSDTPPVLVNTTWELYELSAGYGGGELVELLGFSGARLEFGELADLDDASADFNPFREILVSRGAGGTPERTLEFEANAPLNGLRIELSAGGRVLIEDSDFTYEGFVSEDGKLMVLVMYGSDGGIDKRGLIVGLNRTST